MQRFFSQVTIVRPLATTAAAAQLAGDATRMAPAALFASMTRAASNPEVNLID